jgi:hypothetical protein
VAAHGQKHVPVALLAEQITHVLACVLAGISVNGCLSHGTTLCVAEWWNDLIEM